MTRSDAARLLDADDAAAGRHARDRRRRRSATPPRDGNVVEHRRQAAVVDHRAEVPVEPLLRGLVVVRRHREARRRRRRGAPPSSWPRCAACRSCRCRRRPGRDPRRPRPSCSMTRDALVGRSASGTRPSCRTGRGSPRRPRSGARPAGRSVSRSRPSAVNGVTIAVPDAANERARPAPGTATTPSGRAAISRARSMRSRISRTAAVRPMNSARATIANPMFSSSTSGSAATRADVDVVEAVARVHAQAQLVRRDRRAPERLELVDALQLGRRVGVAAGVELDRVGADLVRGEQRVLARVDEQRDGDAGGAEPRRRPRSPRRGCARDVEPALGGQLLALLGHEAHVRRASGRTRCPPSRRWRPSRG